MHLVYLAKAFRHEIDGKDGVFGVTMYNAGDAATDRSYYFKCGR